MDYETFGIIVNIVWLATGVMCLVMPRTVMKKEFRNDQKKD